MINGVLQNGKLGIHPPETDGVDRFKRLLQSEQIMICPFLGLKNDPETLTNYASEENHCHCNKRPRAIPLDHQQMHCLFEYTRCSIFLKQMAVEVRLAEKQAGKLNGHVKSHPLGIFGVLTNMLGIK